MCRTTRPDQWHQSCAQRPLENGQENDHDWFRIESNEVPKVSMRSWLAHVIVWCRLHAPLRVARHDTIVEKQKAYTFSQAAPKKYD